MDAVTVLYASAAVLLVIAGAAKVIRPATTAALMEMLGAVLRGSVPGTLLARALGLAEITLGIATLLTDVAAFRVVVGVLYVVFALAVWRAISVGATSCGCFGRVDAPPTWLHVFGNLVLAACSFGASPAVLRSRSWRTSPPPVSASLLRSVCLPGSNSSCSRPCPVPASPLG